MAGVRIAVGAVNKVEARVSSAVRPAVEVARDRVRETAAMCSRTSSSMRWSKSRWLVVLLMRLASHATHPASTHRALQFIKDEQVEKDVAELAKLRTKRENACWWSERRALPEDGPRHLYFAQGADTSTVP
jgi:hypothetical protein